MGMNESAAFHLTKSDPAGEVSMALVTSKQPPAAAFETALSN
jgi:hypothetical protein